MRGALAILAVACTVAACETRSRAPTVSPPPPPAASVPRPPHVPAEPLAYLEHCPASSCDARLPLLVVLHGLGDTPENFGVVYQGLRTEVRILVLRAPLPWGDGHAWFPYRSVDTPPRTLVRPLLELVPRVLTTIDHACSAHPCDGRVVVSGFSQGGMLTYALAARAPDRFVAMVPIGGFLVPGIEPVGSERKPRIVVFHGDRDTVVSPNWDREGAARLTRAGFDVDFRLVPGVGHAIPPAERAEVLASIDAALAAQ